MDSGRNEALGTLLCALIWGTQAACVAASSAYAMGGRLFEKCDPIQTMGSVGRAAGLAVSIGFCAAKIFEKFVCKSDDDTQRAGQSIGVCVAAGLTVMTGAHLYERKIPFLATVTFTAFGALGSIVSFIITNSFFPNDNQ